MKNPSSILGINKAATKSISRLLGDSSKWPDAGWYFFRVAKTNQKYHFFIDEFGSVWCRTAYRNLGMSHILKYLESNGYDAQPLSIHES